MKHSEPVFKNIFATSWQELPAVFHKHYANRANASDKTVVEGLLDISCRGPIRLFAPFFRVLGGIPPENEKNVPVTVNFLSKVNSPAFYFDRKFYFKDKKPRYFRSRMIHIEESEVVEIMKWGIGWKMDYLWQDNRVKLIHKGYVFNFFGFFIPLPVTFLLGKGYAEEQAIDENSFAMKVQITHPWWGKFYEYSGIFTVTENCHS